MHRLRRLALCAILIALLLALPSCGSSAGAPPPPAPPAEPEPDPVLDGAVTWATNGCDLCHAADGSGGVGPDVRCADQTRLADYIRDAGTLHMGGAYPDLTDAELIALVEFLASPDCVGGGGELNCLGCHTAAQDNGDGVPVGGRRAVVADFSGASHHMDPAALVNEDCSVCHDLTQHMQGTIRLKNVDYPADAARVIELLGDPMTDVVEAGKLETFCLACHDADAAAGALPFSTALTPPVVAAPSWTASTHATQLTCFGNGSTVGCHTSGHGATQPSMLAAAYSIDDTKAYAAADFQACWNCHDEPTIVRGTNSFGDLHDKHVWEKDSICAECHDPHGSYDASERGHISFARALDRGYDLQLLVNGSLTDAYTQDMLGGSCAIRCHGKTHNPESYPEK